MTWIEQILDASPCTHCDNEGWVIRDVIVFHGLDDVAVWEEWDDCLYCNRSYNEYG